MDGKEPQPPADWGVHSERNFLFRVIWSSKLSTPRLFESWGSSRFTIRICLRLRQDRSNHFCGFCNDSGSTPIKFGQGATKAACTTIVEHRRGNEASFGKHLSDIHFHIQRVRCTPTTIAMCNLTSFWKLAYDCLVPGERFILNYVISCLLEHLMNLKTGRQLWNLGVSSLWRFHLEVSWMSISLGHFTLGFSPGG